MSAGCSSEPRTVSFERCDCLLDDSERPMVSKSGVLKPERRCVLRTLGSMWSVLEAVCRGRVCRVMRIGKRNGRERCRWLEAHVQIRHVDL